MGKVGVGHLCLRSLQSQPCIKHSTDSQSIQCHPISRQPSINTARLWWGFKVSIACVSIEFQPVLAGHPFFTATASLCQYRQALLAHWKYWSTSFWNTLLGLVSTHTGQVRSTIINWGHNITHTVVALVAHPGALTCWEGQWIHSQAVVHLWTGPQSRGQFCQPAQWKWWG